MTTFKITGRHKRSVGGRVQRLVRSLLQLFIGKQYLFHRLLQRKKKKIQPVQVYQLGGSTYYLLADRDSLERWSLQHLEPDFG